MNFKNPTGMFLLGLAIGMLVVLIAKKIDIERNYVKKPV
jgi:hypothetical protein